MTASTRHLVFEMCMGMLLYVLVLGILAVVFQNGLVSMGFSPGPVILGLAAGFAADVLMLLHMAVVTERAADSMDEQYANRITVVQSVIRKVVFIVVLVFLGSRPQVDAVAMIIGAMGLKAGAFLQPVIHRTFFSQRDGNGEERIMEERRKMYGDDEDSDGTG